MALTAPFHAIPGELLETTAPEDADIVHKWVHPVWLRSVSGHEFGLKGSDVFMVLASWTTFDKNGLNSGSPALLMHLRTGKIVKIDDVTTRAWLWRVS